MRHTCFAPGFVLLLISSLTLSAVADEGPLIVFRDDTGHLAAGSMRNATLLTEKAALEGDIALWITFDVEFQPDASQLSPEELDEQNARVERIRDDVLKPLMEIGLVSHHRNGPVARGPGCLISATAAGVRRLVDDQRVIHITDTD